MSDKFDAIQRELADSIMHDLPEELAAVVSIVLHEGGDGLVVNYPKSLHGTADMQLLDGVVRRFGGAFVSRGKGKGSYFLVPRPRRRFPAELANEETVKQAKIDGDKGGCDLPCKPETKQEQSAASPKQPSPVTLFSGNNCSVCEDFGDKCNSRTVSGVAYRSLCLETLRVQQLQSINANLEKLTNRPVYRGGGGRSQQARELHVDGGIKWCWNQSRTYEQAWGDDNKDSKEYADLKTKLAAAKDAGKKGVFMGDFWVFLDGYGKDAVLRKKTQSDSKGGSR